MVVEIADGFLMRNVGLRESQLPYNSEVELTKEVRILGGKRREFIRVKALDKKLNQTQRKTKI